MDSLSARTLDDFRVNACDAINFKLIREKSDIESGETFHPEYTHQMFGESEQIFGYKNLNVNIFYMAGSLSTYIGTTHSGCVNPKSSMGARPDDIFETLSEIYCYDYNKNLVDFTQSFLDESKFSPYGIKRHTYEIAKKTASSKFCIYFIEHGMENFEQFIQYHKRMESFLLFFVDGASAISSDDQQWCFYVIYEQFDVSDSAGPRYAFVGYMTVYKFYAYPKNLRPRVSQVLILPPFRKSGHATQLLQSFYRDFVPVPNVRDITVEDPSEEFQRLRDFLDCKRCLETGEIVNLLHSANQNGFCSDSTRPQNGEAKKMQYDRFRKTVGQILKVNRCQARRIYEILVLFFLPRTDKSVELYANALKRRTTTHFERIRPSAMCGTSLAPKATSSTSSNSPMKKTFDKAADEYFTTQVDQVVNDLLDAYRTTVAKLDHAISQQKLTVASR